VLKPEDVIGVGLELCQGNCISPSYCIPGQQSILSMISAQVYEEEHVASANCELSLWYFKGTPCSRQSNPNDRVKSTVFNREIKGARDAGCLKTFREPGTVGIS
jgi:hypothetical protein